MKKTPLYSASRGRRGKPAQPGVAPPLVQPAVAEPVLPAGPSAFTRLTRGFGRYERGASVLVGVLFTLATIWTYDALRPKPQNLTQENLDAAVLHTWNKTVMPSEATRAYQIVRGSIVMVRGLNTDSALTAVKPDNNDRSGARERLGDHDENQPDADRSAAKPKDHAHGANGVGTGVVLVDDGTILTNLHVVSGSPRIQVVFADGSQSAARVVDIQRENDLAILKAFQVPEDLPPATIRSTADLRPGDKVIAVGFPFGIGPSVSSGVVSGLKRQFHSADGKETLQNLIQFDASANPGNSGGPLVSMDGSVIGIVTGILNPSEHRTFAGIGFAVPIEQAAGGAGPSPF